MDQVDEDGHLDERADDRGEGLAGVDAEDGHGHGDGKFEVVGGGSEGERRRLAVMGAHLAAHVEGDEEHDRRSR